MVSKGSLIFKLEFFTLMITILVYIFPIINLPHQNALAQIIDDSLEIHNSLENDTYQKATVIAPGEYTDLICKDNDWYKVNVPETGNIIAANLKVTIQFSHSQGDLDLILYSTKTSPNDYNFLDISGLTANEEVVSASIPPGNYLIKVYGYKGAKNNYKMIVEILYPCQYVPYNWIEICNEGHAIQLLDNDYKEIEIGFDFKFYGQVFNTVNVSSNGYITFADQTNPSFNPVSPTPISATHRNAPPISIFSYWMNLRPDLDGGVFYKIDQSNPGCKKLIIEWKDIPRDFDSEGISFQAVLFECTDQIMLQYNDVTFSSPNDGYSLGSGATVGIANGKKTANSINRIATQFIYKEPVLTEQTSVIFTPSLSNINYPDIQVSPEDHSFGSVRIGTSSTLTITISNNGNTDLNISGLSLSDTSNFSFDVMGGPNPLGNPQAIISSGENRSIAVTFTPSSVDTFNTALEITSDDPDKSIIDILLHGTGISTPSGWTVYAPDNCFGPDDCLTSHIITAFILDDNETLWIGTAPYESSSISVGGGICAYNINIGTLSCFDENNGLAGNKVIDFALGPQGELWIATNGDIYGQGAGVSLFIGSGMFETYDPIQMGLDDDPWITDIAVDNNSHLWIATLLSGLLEFDGLDWNHYNSAGENITSLKVDSTGKLWIGTLYEGLFVKDPFSIPTHIDLNLGEYISEIAIDPNGNLLIVSIIANENSLILMNPGELLPKSISLPDSLVNNDINIINDLFINPHNGNFFIASDDGFYIYNGQSWSHFNYTNSSLTSLYVNSIIVDPYNDYWVGTEKGISHFNSAPPYIIGGVYGDTGESDNLSIDTSIFMNFSESMNREFTELAFEMIDLVHGNIVNGAFYWNENSTVIEFEPTSSLAYNTNYEVRIFKDASDRAGMTIDLKIGEGANFRAFTISTKGKSTKKTSLANPSLLYTRFLNNYWPKNYLPYWTGYYTVNSSLRIPTGNINPQFKFDTYYMNYQFMNIPQIQSSYYTNFKKWNLYSPSYYTSNIYQAYWTSLQGLNSYPNFCQNH